MLPFIDGHLSWPDEGVLFMRARDGAALREHAFRGLVYEQTFKPDADALSRAGIAAAADEQRRYPLVLVLPPRQRDEARALLARAVERTSAGGRVVACQHNNEGARSMEADLAQLAGPVGTLSKNRCRVCWTQPLDRSWNTALAEAWTKLDQPQRIADGRFVSRPGLFAWDRIDNASMLLARHLPADLSGRAADLGAGFGYLSAELLERCALIHALDVYEAEARALEMARVNLSGFASRVDIDYLWHDVTGGLERSYDVIVTNPPFHTGGRHDRPDLGQRFISVAAEALRPGGTLWLVANRHLPYEAVLSSSFGRVRTVVQTGGFKIVEAARDAARRHA